MNILSFDQFLNEGSYTEQNTPSKFYVCISLKPETYQQLAAGVLPGIAGISGSKENFGHWLHYRDAMLVMDAKTLLVDNKLSRVMYDNPDYIVSDNLKHIARLFNQRDKDGATVTLVRKVVEIIRRKRNFNDSYNRIAYHIGFDDGYKIVDYMKNVRINGVKDIVSAVIKVIDKKAYGDPFEWDRDAIKEVVIEAIKDLGTSYKYEQEWLVKDRTLRIPDGSMLYIAKDGDGLADYTSKIEETGLQSRYRILRFDRRSVEKHGNKVQWKRFDQERIEIAQRHDLSGTKKQLDEIKNDFFTQAIEGYMTYISNPRFELPVMMTTRIRKFVTAYIEEKLIAIPYAELRDVSGWSLNEKVKKQTLAWLDSMDLTNYIEPAERAFYDGEEALPDMAKSLYEKTRKLWHTISANDMPGFYNPW